MESIRVLPTTLNTFPPRRTKARRPPPIQAKRPLRSRRCSRARSERAIGEFPPIAASNVSVGRVPCGRPERIEL